ncbi:MAG TPA: hypothetical protein VHA52_01475, partial [Candidatus Babeliaceae bacterium]|nr:hypothetical protein [Candidatus Babeliaceae bacterium]
AGSILLYCLPLLRSQILILLSSLADIKNLPLGWNNKSFTQLLCPINVYTSLPLFASHNLIVLSLDADARYSRVNSCGYATSFFFSSSAGPP